VKSRLAFFISVSVLAFTAMACNMSTANMSSLKVSKDKDGKQESTSFKSGDTIYANATISNSISKVQVKFRLNAEDVAGMAKGETVKGSEVTIDLPSSGNAIYSLPIPVGVKSGKFTLVADMMNDAGEKKDGKSATLTIEGSAAAPAAPAAKDDNANKSDKKDATKDEDKDEDN